jgi:hypothetical protein
VKLLQQRGHVVAQDLIDPDSTQISTPAKLRLGLVFPPRTACPAVRSMFDFTSNAFGRSKTPPISFQR